MVFFFFLSFVQMQYLRRGTVQEIFSPFASIAVWAAVRFVLKSSTTNTTKGGSSNNQNHHRNLLNGSENHSGHFYAFLPLITDPGDEARNRYYLCCNFQKPLHLLKNYFEKEFHSFWT